MVKGLEPEWGVCSRTVFFETDALSLVSWKNIVAVGYQSGNIIILDAVTGICMSVLFGHIRATSHDLLHPLAFSLDGTFLVSGIKRTIKLWDLQTGGAIKTVHGHTSDVTSVSISPHCTMVVSGSTDRKIYLWDTQTGECCCIIDGHNDRINSVSFSPTNPQLLVSASLDGTIKWWDIDGCQIGPAYEGGSVALSPDGTYFISWREILSADSGVVATIQTSGSGVVIAQLQAPDMYSNRWCISPDNRFVAGAGNAIYVWDITGSDPHLIKSISGTGRIWSLTFSSSLISLSVESSIRFWEICALPIDPVVPHSEPTPPTSVSIESISLQADDGVAISSDSAGVVKAWDISTGLCKTSFQIPARCCAWADARLVNDELIFVWHRIKETCLREQMTHIHAARRIHHLDFDIITEVEGIHIWSTWKGEFQTAAIQPHHIEDLRISGDGSKVFLLGDGCIQAWSVQTGVIVGKVLLEGIPCSNSLVVNGQRVWVHFHDSQAQGWDFGIPNSTPMLLSDAPPDQPCLEFINGTEGRNPSPSRVRDTVVGREVFRLHGKYVRPTSTHWDGRYLVAGYGSGEVLILDFNNVIPQ